MNILKSIKSHSSQKNNYRN